MKRFIYLLIVLVVFGFWSNCMASDVTLKWDANTEADLAGYKLYYDTDSGSPYNGNGANEGSSYIEIPLLTLTDVQNPEFVLTGLSENSAYYFVVTAYDTEGFESDYSNEVSVDFRQDGKPPKAPTGLQAIWQKIISWMRSLIVANNLSIKQ